MESETKMMGNGGREREEDGLGGLGLVLADETYWGRAPAGVGEALTARHTQAGIGCATSVVWVPCRTGHGNHAQGGFGQKK